jgi:tRNA(Ile)-lysidine synthase TilS/MesJ
MNNNTLKKLSNHEKKEILNAVAEIIDREGPLYVRPLYEILKREYEIDLFGENIKDLLKGDPRFTMRGNYQELVTLSEKIEEERTCITDILPSLRDYFENAEMYSMNDVEFLCSKLKKAKFTEKTIIQDMIEAYESLKAGVLEQYIM